MKVTFPNGSSSYVILRLRKFIREFKRDPETKFAFSAPMHDDLYTILNKNNRVKQLKLKPVVEDL